MQRVHHVTTKPTLVLTPTTGVPGFFGAGSPLDPPTVVTSNWVNGIQEELIYIIVQSGLVPNLNVNTQVLDALDIRYGGAGAGTCIQDIDVDTFICVEVTPDEDIIRINTGDSVNGTAGIDVVKISSDEFTVTLPTGPLNPAGSINLTAGSSTLTGFGGGINVTAGDGGVSGDGGAVTINAGNSGTTSGNGGTISLTTGNGLGASAGGDMNFTAGAGDLVAGAGGNVTILAGIGLFAGKITLIGGDSPNSFAGHVELLAGSGVLAGNITLLAGNAGLANGGGPVSITAGAGGATGAGGAVTLTAGAGGTTSGTGGLLTLRGGLPIDGDGGAVTVTGRNAVGTNRIGGALTLTAGNSTGTITGGVVTLTAGAGGTNGNGGTMTISGGLGGTTSGVGGAITIQGGNGNAANGSGGNVIISTGQHFGTGISSTIIQTTQAGNLITRSGNFTIPGDSQSSEYILRSRTLNSTLTEMFLDSTGAIDGTRRMVLPNDTSWAFQIHIIARRTDADNESAEYLRKGAIDRNATAASTILVGAVQTLGTDIEDNAAWDVAITADTTNGSLKIEVAGQTGKTIRWVAFVRTVEVTG